MVLQGQQEPNAPAKAVGPASVYGSLDNPLGKSKLLLARPSVGVAGQTNTAQQDQGARASPLRDSEKSAMRHMVSGVLAGATCATVMSPIDVARTRIMVQGQRLSKGGRIEQRYVGVFSPLRKILVEEGVRGWFRGYGPAMLSVPVFWGVYFPCYDYAKYRLTDRNAKEASSLDNMFAACLAGGVCDVVTNPLWLVRTRLQTQYLRPSADHYKGIVDCIRRIWAEEGFLAFYKGLPASLLGLSHAAIQFPVYEYLKKKIAKENKSNSQWNHSLGIIMASAVSKVIATCGTFPHEVLRARVQNHRTRPGHPTQNFMSVFRDIIRDEGPVGLYKGIQLNLVRVVPACIITFTCYEALMKIDI